MADDIVRIVDSGPHRVTRRALVHTDPARQRGIPYRITSRVTAFEENRLVESQHPLGHRWRREFRETDPGITRTPQALVTRFG